MSPTPAPTRPAPAPTPPTPAPPTPAPSAPRCSALSLGAGEPLAGSAPRADAWIVVEHPDGWGDAALARSGHGVRIVMARWPRSVPAPGAPSAKGRPASRTAGATRMDDGPAPREFRVWVAHCTATPVLRVGSVRHPDEVADWDLAGIAAGSHRCWGRPVEGPLLAVCANGRRDRCCGHEGGRLADVLWAGPHRDRVVTCTHLGGHRFAPTALLLPWGVLHGRLDPTGAEALLEGAAAGWTPTETLRGCSTQDPPAQVAEMHVRRVSGYRGLAPLPVQVDLDPPTTAHTDRAAAATAVATRDGGPDRATARVALADGSTLTVPLERRPHQHVPSCGRPAETGWRWSVAG